MKHRGLARIERGRLRATDHRGVRTDKSPPVSAEISYLDPTICQGCHAVYRRKTWRRAGTRPSATLLELADWSLCPACQQVRTGRFYGRILVRGAWLKDHEDEVRRRLANVEARARHTQPERRLVSVKRTADALEVTTTSQKLAHRLVRELQKAFGGRASYSWSDRDGSLLASWARE